MEREVHAHIVGYEGNQEVVCVVETEEVQYNFWVGEDNSFRLTCRNLGEEETLLEQ